MKVFMFEEEMWPVIYVRPKERAWGPKDIKDIPKELVDRYKAVEEEFSAVQKLLKEYL